jgi:hypothetical protein
MKRFYEKSIKPNALHYRISYGIYGGGFLLTCKVAHEGILHETDRNMALLAPLGIDEPPAGIKIYFSEEDIRNVSSFKEKENMDDAFAALHTVPMAKVLTSVQSYS